MSDLWDRLGLMDSWVPPSANCARHQDSEKTDHESTRRASASAPPRESLPPPSAPQPESGVHEPVRNDRGAIVLPIRREEPRHRLVGLEPASPTRRGRDWDPTIGLPENPRPCPPTNTGTDDTVAYRMNNDEWVVWWPNLAEVDLTSLAERAKLQPVGWHGATSVPIVIGGGWLEIVSEEIARASGARLLDGHPKADVDSLAGLHYPSRIAMPSSLGATTWEATLWPGSDGRIYLRNMDEWRHGTFLSHPHALADLAATGFTGSTFRQLPDGGYEIARPFAGLLEAA